MTALDAPTQQQPAVPAPTVGPAPAGDSEPGPYIGRHRPADPREPRHARHLIPTDRRVPADWWPPTVHRRCDADTALIPPVPAETEVTR
ncbi:hypothetical protein ACIBCR_16525 [Micromonospora echinospora]|uniref:hypothetical protein n=1 Tax=Micromonospora echinospora TaxID=1877 RepID=UPI0037AD2E35